MPVVIPFIPLIAAGLTAASTGVGLYETLSQPGHPSASNKPTPLTASQNRQQEAAVGQALPNLQSLTGGSLSPEYAAQFGATQAGLANDPQASGNVQAAINQFFGLAAPGNTGLTPSTTGGGNWLADLIAKVKPTDASPGGGIADLIKMPSGGGAPGGGGNFANDMLSGDLFKGLTG